MMEELPPFDEEYVKGSETKGQETGTSVDAVLLPSSAASTEDALNVYGSGKPRRVIIRGQITNEPTS